VTTLQNTRHIEHLLSTVGWVLPEVALVGGACLLLIAASLKSNRGGSAFLAILSILGAGAIAWFVPEETNRFDAALTPIDPTGAASFLRWLSLASGLLYVLVGWGDTKTGFPAETYASLLVVVAGMSLVGRANDFVTLFLALEMISIPTYVLLYLPATNRSGQESALKYFLLSVLSSGILLFGFSYLFGLTGSTNLSVVSTILTAASADGVVSPMALVAIVLAIGGLGFRIAAVPFHFYAPDVYEGGPTSTVAQLAYVPKVAGFVALARLLGLTATGADGLPFDSEHTLIPLMLWVMAVVTMSFGNLLALIQDNLKRLFAYSGIAHGGYMLIGLTVACATPHYAAEHSGYDVVLFYLVGYGLSTIGFFAVLASLSNDGRRVETADDLAGLGQTNPLSAALLAIFLLSFIGIPVTAGFLGKFNLFLAAFEVPTELKMKFMFRILIGIAVLNAAIAAVYYLRLLGLMYLRTPLKPVESRKATPQWLAAFACGVGTIALGVFPQPLMDRISKAAPVPVVESTSSNR